MRDRMMRLTHSPLLSLLLLLGSCYAAREGLFESFQPGWEARWHYSTAKKYNGRFQTVPRPSSRGRDTGILVRWNQSAAVAQVACTAGTSRP